MNITLLNQRARSVAVWGLAALGFALPLTPALANLMLLLVVVSWLLSGHWQEKWAVIKTSAAAKAAGLFYGLVLIGMLYGVNDDSTHYASKYASIFILPIILTLQLSAEEKWRAIGGFCAAMVLTLFLSMLIWLEWLPIGLFKNTHPTNPIVFKLHITHGFFMILAAFFLYVAALRLPDNLRRYGILLLVFLAISNALFMIQGRTGQMALLGLLVFLFHMRFPRYGLLIGLIASIGLASVAYIASPSFKLRTDTAISEGLNWSTTRGDQSSSIGMRFDYYATSLAIIKQHPIIGVGTDGFPKAYEAQIVGTPLPPSNNPHNQYLLIAAQYGLIGLGVLFFFYFSCWRQALAQPQPFVVMAIGVLIAFLIGNLFNSFMLDLAERLMFVWAMGVLLSSAPPNHTH
ncbi:MAG: O-antigen ligase family protein [Rhodocyclaceae bacterium]|nr:O-antigen ligase family protein [Rhodocyclaceae bacterium]